MDKTFYLLTFLQHCIYCNHKRISVDNFLSHHVISFLRHQNHHQYRPILKIPAMLSLGFSLAYIALASASDVTPTERWLNIWYGSLSWKHFRSFEVVIRLVRLYRISGRRVSRSLTFRLKQKCCDAKLPHRRKKPLCLQLWRRALIRIN